MKNIKISKSITPKFLLPLYISGEQIAHPAFRIDINPYFVYNSST